MSKLANQWRMNVFNVISLMPKEITTFPKVGKIIFYPCGNGFIKDMCINKD
jgi:hypothetical protein